MPRHQRILTETGTYHVMMRGNERKNLFLDDHDRQRFLETLFSKKQETGLFLYAYCLMDNHVHLLVREGKESLATTMKRVSTSYVYYFNQKNQRIGHLFQDRFKSEPIEDDSYLLAAARYIHNNPVKAGIVEKADKYRWSSYSSYLAPDKPEARDVDIEFILSILSLDRPKAIREFKLLSGKPNPIGFIDVVDESSWSVAEGKQFLEEYLQKEWPGSSLPNLMVNAGTRNEIVAYMRGNTGLSIRKIADLLGLKRGSVQSVVPK
ncbi:MAG: REP-associated tyrosine transposase [Chitinophagales bacterium]